MKFATSSSVLALAAASAVSAQSYTNQSAPFTLQIANSANASLDGLYFFACHAGAAIEGLCVGGSSPTASSNSSTFYFNTTNTDETGGDNGDTSQGLLVWYLPVSGLAGVDSIPETLDFPSFPVDSNVVVPLFGDGDELTVQFTDDDKLVIPSNYNDADNVQGVYTPPPTTATLYNHWYACWTEVGSGYMYEALGWVTSGKPHNPTCQKIDVVRKFL